MIKPEELLARAEDGMTVETRSLDDWWCQQVRDKDGKDIYSMDSNGLECWRKYTHGNVTHYRDSTGFECWRKNNSNGLEVYYRNSLGRELWHEYDCNGVELGYKDNTGTATGIYAIEDELVADEACLRREPLERTVEQRLEDIESSLDRLSQQMTLLIKAMATEYKLGDYE